MKQYPLWKTVSLIVALIFGALYSAPNLFGGDPAVQISTTSGESLPADFKDRLAKALGDAGIGGFESEPEGKEWLLRFPTPDAQLKGSDAVKQALGRGYVVALNTASKTPAWLSAIGAKPMTLGLDLRGGVHFLLEVDIEDAKKSAIQRYLTDIPALLRKQEIRYTGRRLSGNAILIEFADAERQKAAQALIAIGRCRAGGPEARGQPDSRAVAGRPRHRPCEGFARRRGDLGIPRGGWRPCGGRASGRHRQYSAG
jgi:preprotein translocase subunit SecD